MNLTNSMVLTRDEVGQKSPWWSILFVILTFLFTSIPFGLVIGIMALLAGVPLESILMQSDSSSYTTLINLSIFPMYLLIILLINKYFYKRTTESLGFFPDKKWQYYGVGIGIGLGAFLLVYALNGLLGSVSTTFNSSVDWVMIVMLFIAFGIQGMTEEVMLRGFIMNVISSKKGVVTGILLNSFLFALMHMGNDNVTFLSIFNIFIFGLLFSLLFYWSDNLWLTGAAHSLWNFTMGPVLGIEVSGMVLEGTIFKTISYPDKTLINGGGFGLEGGIITTVVGLSGCLLLLWLSRKKWQSNY